LAAGFTAGGAKPGLQLPIQAPSIMHAFSATVNDSEPTPQVIFEQHEDVNSAVPSPPLKYHSRTFLEDSEDCS
jgi:hypothetical protein